MCGIIGYIGHRNAEEILLKGLELLEYRGYDSAGIALLNQAGTLRITKRIGKVQELVEACKKEPQMGAFCGIGHTRWATHGGVTNLNAHPHSVGKVTLIHNGIIENYQELSADYCLAKKLKSQTDTEVVAALLDHFYDKDPAEAIRRAVCKLKGTYALCIMFADIPDKIFAIRNVSPILAGVGSDGEEAFLASDITAIAEYVSEYFVIPENVLTIVEAGKITLLDQQGEEVAVKLLSSDWGGTFMGKKGYEYYMEKEILEQPEVIGKTIQARCKEGLPDFTIDKIPDDIWRQYDKITMIACGTAMHAGLIAKSMLQSVLGLQVNVEVASEFIYNNPVVDKKTLVIAISQSGETIDTLEALRYAKRKGAGNLAIVNVKGSVIARESDYVFYTDAGPEIAVASTKAYTTQVAALYLIACKMAYVRGVYTREEARKFMEDLIQVPDKLEQIFKQRETIHDLTRDVVKAQDVFMIGRGLDYPVLLEGSLKLKEISYIHSEAYASGELKHGTIALITEDTPVITLITQSHIASKSVSNAIEVKARGAKVIMIARKDIFSEIGQQWGQVFYLPTLREEFMVFPAVAVLQLMAFYVSRDKGLDVDKPRNLAKVVTVE